MATLRRIPDTRKGQAYRRVAWVVGIASIVGLADQLRALFWFALAGVPEGGGPAELYAARVLITLAGWTLVCWCAVIGVRKNAIPPTWALVSMPLMVWAVLLLPLVV
jgi:hypothetical protein